MIPLRKNFHLEIIWLFSKKNWVSEKRFFKWAKYFHRLINYFVESTKLLIW